MKTIHSTALTIFVLHNPANTIYFIGGEKAGKIHFLNTHDANHNAPIHVSTDEKEISDTINLVESEGYLRYTLVTIHLENLRVTFSSNLVYTLLSASSIKGGLSGLH